MNENEKLTIRMLSAATSVDGQGVGSAYLEQVALVREQEDLFEVLINKEQRRRKADIYHVHTVNPYAVLQMKKKRCSVIYVHFLPDTLDGSLKMPRLFMWFFKKYVVHYYRKAKEVVVVNPVFIEPLIELGIKRENITYIPNFVDHEKFHTLTKEEIDAAKDKFGIPKDKFVITGCGQVQTRKGVLDFIECAKRNPDLCFIWAGGFSFGRITDGYNELKQVMENPPANVKFLGIVPRDEMNLVFNCADMLFMPSFAELFPMSILEAVNSHKPVLLRDIDIYPIILFDDYAKAKDIDGFDAEIKRLATDKAYYEEYAKKAEHISTFYSKEYVANQWREYYPRVYQKFLDSQKKK